MDKGKNMEKEKSLALMDLQVKRILSEMVERVIFGTEEENASIFDISENEKYFPWDKLGCSEYGKKLYVWRQNGATEEDYPLSSSEDDELKKIVETYYLCKLLGCMPFSLE